MIIRIYYEKLGGHYHCRVFTGLTLTSVAKSGDLVFRENEWDQFRIAMSKTDIEFINTTRT